MNIDWIKKRKLLVILLFITIISFILGSLFISILSDNNQVLVKESIINYFNGIKTGHFTYLKNNNLTARKTCITLWSTNNKAACGVNKDFGILVHKGGRDYRFDNLF